MMNYKLVVLDLDGTLTNDRKEITPRTKGALMKAQEKGVKIILASGRPTYGITPLADQLEINKFGGYIMSFNGGKIIDWTTKKVLFEQKLAPSLVPLLYEKAMSSGMNILTYQGQNIVATKARDQYVQKEAFINKMPVVQLDDFLHQVVYPLNKCLIVGDPVPLHHLELQLAGEMQNKMEIYRSADFFLECVPLHIDKAHALDWLVRKMKIRKDEIIACGDGHNDLSMVEFAGLGVAMANAVQSLRDVADYITLSNEEDGVAHVIEKYIL